ncbi:CDK5 and ABL1 enzyme substrate 2 [Denticeps clupeoides]|uniref:Cyclin N-terminal domain-containing protein n=1 Tax=Denticeps clupeoides TaxID=299321 RepID=A0AAY4EEA9_9TELE|nr:CDK5 and ABL1 enzyme substrate 2-like [Denticeps clupeoides]
MAAAACGPQRATVGSAAKPHKELLRRTKDSRRRQAALLFLTNISLDGRPVYRLSNGSSAIKEAESRSEEVGAPPAGLALSTTSSYGTITHLSTSASGGGSAVTPLPRASTLPSALLLSGAGDSGPGGADYLLLPLDGGGKAEPLSSQGSPLSPNPARSPTAPSLQNGSSVPTDPRGRLRSTSGTRPHKKVHFIKNMRQYDTGGSRVVLICAKRSMCSTFSVLPYGDNYRFSDLRQDAQRQRHPSGSVVDMVPGLEGVELGEMGETVSYARFLLPTNALVRQKSSGPPDAGMVAAQTPMSCNRNSTQRAYMPGRLNSAMTQDPSIDDLADYDPNLLSDPQWPCGKHKRVLIFASYVTTVIEYVKPSDLKKDMNETFKEKFPHIKLTLSKIRSLKREMRAVSEECGLQPVTVAMAHVYFEKLVLQGRLNKNNRKLVSAACVLLAAKISSDLKKHEVKQLIDKLEERFRINRRELIPLEFTVLVALEMALYLPDRKVMPHYRRLVQQA